MPTPNVDTAAPDARRAKQIQAVLLSVCDALDTEASAPDALRFMLHLVWHESRRCKTRTQDGNGPARGFPQFEAHRARDTLDYALLHKKDKPFWRLLIEAAKESEPTVDETAFKAATEALPEYGEPTAPNFPQGNLIERLLVGTDRFGGLLMRVALKKIAAALPASNDEDVAYWEAEWKRAHVSADERRRFLAAATDLDRLLGGLASA